MLDEQVSDSHHFFLLVLVDSVYGFTRKPRTCEKKTLTTELMFLFHVLIMTYSMLSPFILKDYISNLMFNATMMLSWFLTDKVKDKPICMLSAIEDVVCEDNEPLGQVPTQYVILTTAVMLYDVYMLLRA